MHTHTRSLTFAVTRAFSFDAGFSFWAGESVVVAAIGDDASGDEGGSGLAEDSIVVACVTKVQTRMRWRASRRRVKDSSSPWETHLWQLWPQPTAPHQRRKHWHGCHSEALHQVPTTKADATG